MNSFLREDHGLDPLDVRRSLQVGAIVCNKYHKTILLVADISPCFLTRFSFRELRSTYFYFGTQFNVVAHLSC